MPIDIELEFSKSHNLRLVWFFPLHARQVSFFQRDWYWTVFSIVDLFAKEWFTACHKDLWQVRKNRPIANDKKSSLETS